MVQELSNKWLWGATRLLATSALLLGALSVPVAAAQEQQVEIGVQEMPVNVEQGPSQNQVNVAPGPAERQESVSQGPGQNEPARVGEQERQTEVAPGPR